jgi:2,3,4,5-tetrahydropyridine-2-carboxylate N-succinyltransferase
LQALSSLINAAFERRAEIRPETATADLKTAVDEVLGLLDGGHIRVAEKLDGEWITHSWIKRAVLLAFRVYPNTVTRAGDLRFYDKLPTKFRDHTEEMFRERAIRVVPPATVRFGSYIGRHAVLMPSYVNVGAFVGDGAMVDTWATVGSCAQIGAGVHLSGGVGIGGVLEPVQANPTIIEDNCFIGARSEVVEGIIVGEGSVISMGVFIGASTPIYDRETRQVHRGRVPPGSVVIAGSLPSADGTHATYAAIIVRKVDAKTKAKTAINELVR